MIKYDEPPYLYPNLKRQIEPKAVSRRSPIDEGVLSILVKVLLGVGPAEAPPQEKSLE